MARFAAVKCPTCGANLRIDPALEFALCPFCNTSSFVQTRARPLSQQLSQRHPPIIDVRGRSSGWIAGTAAIFVFGGLIAGAAGLLERAGRVRSAPAALPIAAPAVLAQEPVASAQQAPSSARTWGDDSAPPPAPDSHASARGKATPPTAKTTAKTTRGTVTVGQLTVSGRLGPDLVRRVVDGNNSRFRLCYEQGLARIPTMTGSLDVRFVIGRDGSVSNVSQTRADLPDTGVMHCVMSAFYGLRFPAPEGGIVTVVYPLRFRPG
jgi:hypothetical protein